MKNRIANFYKNPTPTKLLGTGILALILLISVVTFVMIDKKKNEFKTENNPVKAKEVAEDLAGKVSKIMRIPNEIPTIATIVDASVLPKDPFYQFAQDGDKILIFAGSQKVILYRPSENKVIDVGNYLPNEEYMKSAQVAGIEAANASPSGETTSATPSAIPTPRIIFEKVN